jgi:hypothetical protein
MHNNACVGRDTLAERAGARASGGTGSERRARANSALATIDTSGSAPVDGTGLDGYVVYIADPLEAIDPYRALVSDAFDREPGPDVIAVRSGIAA